MCLEGQIQTRSEETGTCNHITLQDALRFARDDKSIWKISFDSQTGERVRLVRENGDWIYRSLNIDYKPLRG